MAAAEFVSAPADSEDGRLNPRVPFRTPLSYRLAFTDPSDGGLAAGGFLLRYDREGERHLTRKDKTDRAIKREERILARIDQGESIRLIAADLGVSHQRIYQIRKRAFKRRSAWTRKFIAEILDRIKTVQEHRDALLNVLYAETEKLKKLENGQDGHLHRDSSRC